MTDFDDDLRTAVATVAARTVAPPFELVGDRARARRTRRVAAGAIGAVALVTSVAIAIPGLRDTRGVAPAASGAARYCDGTPGTEILHGGTSGHTWSWTVHRRPAGYCEVVLVDGVRTRYNIPAQGGPVPGSPVYGDLFASTSGATRWVLVKGVAYPNVVRVVLTVNGHSVVATPVRVAGRAYFGAVVEVTGPVVTIGGSGYDAQGNEVLVL